MCWWAGRKGCSKGPECPGRGSRSVALVCRAVPSLAERCALWPEGSISWAGHLLLGLFAALCFYILINPVWFGGPVSLLGVSQLYSSVFFELRLWNICQEHTYPGCE